MEQTRDSNSRNVSSKIVQHSDSDANNSEWVNDTTTRLGEEDSRDWDSDAENVGIVGSDAGVTGGGEVDETASEKCLPEKH
jgi:hypothetical protein